jgi:hypothetical protein
VGHACLVAGHRFPQPDPAAHLVVLAVPTAAHLHDALLILAANGIPYAVFHEPDDAMGDTAACTAPLPASCRRVFRRFPLWTRGPP